MLTEAEAVARAKDIVNVRGGMPLRYHSVRFMRGADLPPLFRAIGDIRVAVFEYDLPPDQSISHAPMVTLNAITDEVVPWPPRLTQ